MKNIFWGWGSGSSPETDGAKRLTFDSVLHRFSRVRLCHPMDCSPPGSSVHGILQARILEWLAIPFSRRSFQPRGRTQVSCIVGGFSTAKPPGKPVMP